ncbi:ectin-like [Actinia tenebrosa]|uniref:Ectin-like n=1 Tax=Actinia tenebrosa TaxID=6105 RepID=A0A6P8ISN1_ACTTE|nr:ectin-like [Actinia tenebrosa]
MESFKIVTVVLSSTFLLASLTNALSVDACLERHNKYRNRHGAPPLKWDSYLAKHALEWANELSRLGKLKRDTQKKYSEYDRYREAGGCEAAPDYAPPFTSQFTQLVWKFTERLGVAVVDDIVVARYHPPGNFPGEFVTEVRCRDEKKVKKVYKNT